MQGDAEAPTVTRAFYWSVVALAVVIGAAWRLSVISPPGFPLGEGGLFVLFSREILSHGFALPEAVTYGGLTIPFAYPPLGFYLAAAAAALLDADLFSVYYWLPILLNLAAIPAFCFLAAQLTNDRVVLFGSSLLFVQLPDSFMWQITGGGLPRALGALFALVGVALAFRLVTGASKPLLLACGTCIGLAILSHLEWGLFGAMGVALAVASTSGTWRRRASLTIAVGFIALIVISPWLLLILNVHGFEPFRSSSSASSWNAGTFVGNLWIGRVFGLLLWPALLGVFLTLSRGKWFLPLWLVSVALITPRMGASAGLAIPASILAGYGLKGAGQFMTDLTDSLGGFQKARAAFRRSWFGVGIPVIALLLAFSTALLTPVRGTFHDPSSVQQLDAPSRSAMHWIRESTPPETSFVVASSAQHWFLDRAAEWFPFLAERTSLTTAQGLEWGGRGAMTAKVEKIAAFKTTQSGTPTLLPFLIRANYCGADYVALFFPEHAPERRAFEGATSYIPVYSNQSAQIFRLAAASCQEAGS